MYQPLHLRKRILGLDFHCPNIYKEQTYHIESIIQDASPSIFLPFLLSITVSEERMASKTSFTSDNF